MLKKIIFLFIAMLTLAGCASTNPTITLAPTIALPSPQATAQGITISITGADKRKDPALAKLNQNGQLLSLSASRDPRFLLQEALEKQMAARGYSVGANGAVNVQVVINELYADVSQGDLRYHIATSANITLIASSRNGKQFTQNYHARYSAEGAFQATNRNIANTINITLSNMITDMANDKRVADFITNNAR